MRLDDALHVLTVRRGLTLAALHALADAMNGVLWSDEIRASEQVRAAAEAVDPDALTVLDLATLYTLTDAEAEAVRLVVWEVLRGRPL